MTRPAGGRTVPALVVGALAAVVGLVASLAIARAAYQVGVRPGGPARPDWPGEQWLRSTVGIPTIPDGRRTWYAAGLALGLAWVALAAAGARLARLGWRPRVRLAAVIAVAVLWMAPLVLAPPVGSRDVYSYVAHGELASAGLDPGAVSPREGLELSSLAYHSVDVTWRGVVSAYGPLATGLSEVAVRLSGHDMVGAVLIERLWSLLGVALLAGGLVALAGRAPGRSRSPDVVLALAVASPITVLHLIGGAHNEALMMGLAVAGLAVAEAGGRRNGRARWVWWTAGVVLVGLGAAVKVPALLAAAYLGWNAPGPDAPLVRRVGGGAVAGAISVGTIALVSALTGSGWGWLGGAGAGGKVFTVLSVSSTVGALLARPFYRSTRGIQSSPYLAIARGLALAASVAIAGTLVWQSPVLGLNALGWALLAVGVLGPAVHPWYLVWGQPVLALQPQGRAEPWLQAAVVVAAVSTRPQGGGAWPNVGVQPWRLLVVVAVAAALAVAFRAASRRRRGEPAPPAANPYPVAPAPAPSDISSPA